MCRYGSKIIWLIIVITFLAGIGFWYFAYTQKDAVEKISTSTTATTSVSQNKNDPSKMIILEGDLEKVTDGDKIKIQLGEKIYAAEIARTPEARSRGLSGREGLGENDGLLFIFEEPGYPGFWMKDMKFAIDIIWLDENLTVVDVTKNAAPDSYPQIFHPKSPAQYVLEIFKTKIQ